jgi:hypothetical protein
MKKKFIGALATALLALAAFGSTSASAATAVGSNCTGDSAEVPTATLVQLSSPTSPSSASVPVAGVVTKWGVNVIPYAGGISEKLKVLRPAGGNNFTTVGESTSQPIVSGQNTFDTRIPVQVGDHLGANSAVSVIYCVAGSTPADLIGAAAGDTSNGSTADFPPATEGVLALSATVEPDGDGDGFGDETQDQCPQNAAVQIPCPVVKLSVSSLVKKTFARVLVTSNIQAPVTVKGTVNLGKGRKAKLNGGTQIVVPGTIAKFTILFPAALKERLKELSRKQSVRLALAVTAPNIVDKPTTKRLKVKVKGQKKPARKGKKGKGKGKGGKRG